MKYYTVSEECSSCASAYVLCATDINEAMRKYNRTQYIPKTDCDIKREGDKDIFYVYTSPSGINYYNRNNRNNTR